LTNVTGPRGVESGKRLARHLPADAFQLLGDVDTRTLESFAAGRARSVIDELLHMPQRVLTREFFPDLHA
jgi:hypothetical protein